jgi:putative phosphoesterase
VETIAIISDIHGNRWALERVLEDIYTRGINKIFNLGDSLYGPLDPAGTAEILMKKNVVSISGNEDRIIHENGEMATNSPTLNYVRENLNREHILWLKSLKMAKSIAGDFLLCHGTPFKDNEYLLHQVNSTGLFLRSVEDLKKLVGNRPEKIILCGHDHLPNVVSLDQNQTVINPGSVGLQAYQDDLPFVHSVENGSPNSRYSIIFPQESGIKVEQVLLQYDFITASEEAKKNKREDWSHWLKTGRAL